MFAPKSIDNIVKKLAQTIDELDKAAMHHGDQVRIQQDAADAATNRAAMHRQEFDRAQRVRSKIADIIN